MARFRSLRTSRYSGGSSAPRTSSSAAIVVPPVTIPTIVLSPLSAISLTAGTPFTRTFSASGGTAPYTYAVATGSLPAGLTLNGAGLSGTPTTASAFSFGIRATDAAGYQSLVALFAGVVADVVVTPPAPVFSIAPVITGTPTEGQTLTATTGAASGSPSYALQWKRNGSNISGATGTTYLLVTADVGATITVTSTATNSGGSASSTSSATATIAAVGEPTYDATLIPPFIQLEGTRDTTPLVVIVQTDSSHALGGKYRLELDEDPAFGSPTLYDYTPTADDFTDDTFNFGLSGVTGTQRIRGYWITAGNLISGPSNQLLWGPNDVAPLLSNPSAFTTITASSAASTVDTDWNDGTLYAVDTLTNVAPSAVQIEAGQNAAGTAAAWAGNQAITTPGTKTVTSSGLFQATPYYRWYMHKPAVGPRSAVLAGGTYTTGAASVFSASEVDAVGAFPNYGSGASYTFAGRSLGAADANRKILVSLMCFNDGGAISGVTVAGVAATQIDSNSVMSAWEATVPTGTTGDVVVNTANSIVAIAAKLTRVVGASGSPTVAKLAPSFYEVAQMNLNVTTPAGGATIIGAYWDATTARDFTGATKTSQTTFGTRSQAGAIRTTAGAGTVQVTGGGGTGSGMTAVSYAP